MSLPRTDGWSEPRPAVLPEPTYWPAALALGCTLLLWGVLTTWLISAVGLGLLLTSLVGWLRDLVRSHRMEGP